MFKWRNAAIAYIFWSDCANYSYHFIIGLFLRSFFIVDRNIQKGSGDLVNKTSCFWSGFKIELIWFSMIAIEEDNGFGCGIVDAHSFSCLNKNMFTSLISNFSLSTSVRRRNFCCWVTLLYLHEFLPLFICCVIIIEWKYNNYFKIIMQHLQINIITAFYHFLHLQKPIDLIYGHLKK